MMIAFRALGPARSVLSALLHKVLASVVLAAVLIPAHAADFTVSPVRIYMNPSDRAVAVTLSNEGGQALVMQADLYVWTQSPDGEDELEFTEDLFLSPPIIRLEPNARQVVRLARLTTAEPPEQLTYRLIVREIPEALAADDQLQVQVALALSLPIFITPRNAASRLDCTAGRESATTVNVVCSNDGNAYAQPREIRLEGAGGQTIVSQEAALYILPGAGRSYSLVLDGAIPATTGQLVVVLDDNSEQRFSVQIN